MKSGKWAGGIVPYGYKLGPDGHLVVSEAVIPGTQCPEAEVVRMVFRWATGRTSTLKIARKLNELGIPPHYVKEGRQIVRGKRKHPTAGKWFCARVGVMIRNTTYAGVHIYGKRSHDPQREPIRRDVPAIVSPELWQQAQDAIRQNARWAKRNGKHDYLLSGLLRCDFCGRRLTGTSVGRSPGMRFYYRCYGQISSVRDAYGPCQGRFLQQDWIEGLVWSELEDWIIHHTNLEEIITDALHEQDRQRHEWRTTLARVRAEIGVKDEERDRIVTAYRKGWLSSEDLERQLTAVKQEKQQLARTTAELETRHDLHVDLEEAVAAVRQQLNHFREALEKGAVSFSQRRQIVEAFVKEVRVRLTKGGKRPAGGSRPVVIETIPFRPETPDTPHAGERVTAWERPENSSIAPLPEEVVRVLYRFPFPPAPKKLVSIADYTEGRAVL